MRAVDTNVLVRLIARDDPRQTAAAESFVASGAWVSHVALVETVLILSSVYELSRTRIGVVVGGLLQHRTLVIQEADVVQAALDEFRVTPRVAFSDCMLLHAARKAGHVPPGHVRP